MRAVIATEPGGPEVLTVVDRPDPRPGPGELLVRVRATSVNRADVMQRMGLYPPPPGASDVLGLEAAGEVVALGDGVDHWTVGEGCTALLAGGGYAELAVVPASVALPWPGGLSAAAAGSTYEVYATAYDNLFVRGRLRRGETALIHGGASGVGTAGIQLAKRAGCQVIVTAGGADRAQTCVDELGADAAIDYRGEDVVERVQELTEGRGVDVILDVVGGPYLDPNLRCLATEGRLVIIGLQGGATAEVDLARMLRRRLTVSASTLRARSTDEKAWLAARLRSDVWPGFDEGSLAPVIDSVHPIEEVAAAHARMESGGHVGKIALTF